MNDLYNLDTLRTREAGSRSAFSAALFRLYKIRPLRRRVVALCRRLESGDMFSETLREIQRTYHGVEVGRYSYGVFDPASPLPRGTVVGRYASIAPGVKVYRRTRDWTRLALHPFFYNSALNVIREEKIPFDHENPLTIGSDVWIGYNSIILHECTKIGHGAIIGAGSTVTTDIPPFALAVGSPAKVLRYRFDEALREKILASRWWELGPEEIIQTDFDMVRPVDPSAFEESGFRLDLAS